MTVWAEKTLRTPTFLDDLTPGSGLALRRWTPDEYRHRAVPAVFGPDERTELIYGLIIKRMSPMGRPHGIAVSKTAAALTAAFGGYAVEQQVSLQLAIGLEPLPEIIVLSGTSDGYADAPIPSNILLLVEVSNTTLRCDRNTKATMYAAEAIPDYWLVNLRARMLEVRRQPEGGEYVSLDVYGEGEAVAPLAAPNAPVRVADLLPLARPGTR